jgi:hypothetical protein
VTLRGDGWRVLTAALCTAILLLFTVATVWLLSGCRGPAALPAPCDELTLAGVVAECRSAVRSGCARSDAGVVDEDCAVLRECDRRIAAWKACRDGGVGIGAGGAP